MLLNTCGGILFMKLLTEAFYISGVKNKTKYKRSKITVFFFQIFHMNIYALLHAYDPIIEALLPQWYLQNMPFESLTLLAPICWTFF